MSKVKASSYRFLLEGRKKFKFCPPPEAPVFEPTNEEFENPLNYIDSIKEIGEKYGIIKIRPPPEWQPPFAIDMNTFKFRSRIQQLSELEARNRIKLNFITQIKKFWELQGVRLRYPFIRNQRLDLYILYYAVKKEGGYHACMHDMKWVKIATRMHFSPLVAHIIAKHYENILYPFAVFEENKLKGTDDEALPRKAFVPIKVESGGVGPFCFILKEVVNSVKEEEEKPLLGDSLSNLPNDQERIAARQALPVKNLSMGRPIKSGSIPLIRHTSSSTSQANLKVPSAPLSSSQQPSCSNSQSQESGTPSLKNELLTFVFPARQSSSESHSGPSSIPEPLIICPAPYKPKPESSTSSGFTHKSQFKRGPSLTQEHPDISGFTIIKELSKMEPNFSQEYSGITHKPEIKTEPYFTEEPSTSSGITRKTQIKMEPYFTEEPSTSSGITHKSQFKKEPNITQKTSLGHSLLKPKPMTEITHHSQEPSTSSGITHKSQFKKEPNITQEYSGITHKPEIKTEPYFTEEPSTSSGITHKSQFKKEPNITQEVLCSGSAIQKGKLVIQKPSSRLLIKGEPSNKDKQSMASSQAKIYLITNKPSTSKAEPTQFSKLNFNKFAEKRTNSDSLDICESQLKKSKIFHGEGRSDNFNSHAESDPLAKYICKFCDEGDDEECMLLCDGCDDSYHTFCLKPPLLEVPKGDWKCPVCVEKDFKKPSELFGFATSETECSLAEFGEKAEQFKNNYFSKISQCYNSNYAIPEEIVENEYWRILSDPFSKEVVEYGADLHSLDHNGSGFPSERNANTIRDPETPKYLRSPWNLNNLPVLKESLLSYISEEIPGMKVPWMYVGMCFSTFCWHNEDHWSYSINYLHWGDAKTWYGVPGSKATEFEKVMKLAAPELFEEQPDLLHQLTTILNPNVLMAEGVPIFRTDQQAGEFVVTFPRAYHAGFNQGFNFAEAVNFAPLDWLPAGRESIKHYALFKRYNVFSQDELIVKIALQYKEVDKVTSAAVYNDFVDMVNEESEGRCAAHEWGLCLVEEYKLENLPDDARQCFYCNTTLYLSAVVCECEETKDKLSCLKHFKELCKCPPFDHILRYRWDMVELPKMGLALREKVLAESPDEWCLSA